MTKCDACGTTNAATEGACHCCESPLGSGSVPPVVPSPDAATMDASRTRAAFCLYCGHSEGYAVGDDAALRRAYEAAKAHDAVCPRNPLVAALAAARAEGAAALTKAADKVMAMRDLPGYYAAPSARAALAHAADTVRALAPADVLARLDRERMPDADSRTPSAHTDPQAGPCPHLVSSDEGTSYCGLAESSLAAMAARVDAAEAALTDVVPLLELAGRHIGCAPYPARKAVADALALALTISGGAQ